MTGRVGTTAKAGIVADEIEEWQQEIAAEARPARSAAGDPAVRGHREVGRPEQRMTLRCPGLEPGFEEPLDQFADEAQLGQVRRIRQ